MRATFENDIIQNNAFDGLDVYQLANVSATGVTLQGNQGGGVGVFSHSTLIAVSTTAQSNISGGTYAVGDSLDKTICCHNQE